MKKRNLKEFLKQYPTLWLLVSFLYQRVYRRSLNVLISIRRQPRVVGPKLTLPPAEGPEGISAIIVNYNGAKYLKPCIESLLNSYRKPSEIIVVENGSNDNSLEVLHEFGDDIKLIPLKANIGFAGGANEGQKHAKSRYIFLLNSDAVIDPNGLDLLIARLEANKELAAVSPKVVFSEDFAKISLKVAPQNSARVIASSLWPDETCYQKIIPSSDWSNSWTYVEGSGQHPDIQFSKTVDIWMPHSAISRLQNISIENEQPDGFELEITIGDWSCRQELRSGKNEINVQIPAQLDFVTFINNAGTQFIDGLNPSDIGFNEIDNRQFDNFKHQDALCGCAMMIDTAALYFNEAIFDPVFFAYFEDTDFSQRLTKRGYKLGVDGQAVVRHRHASTFGENSEFFRFMTARNKVLFHYKHAEIVEFQKSLGDYETGEPELLNSLSTEFKEHFEVVPIRTMLNKLMPKKTINGPQLHDEPLCVVYNEFWTTLGGGEYRALKEALSFSDDFKVILIPCSQNTKNDLANQFGLDLSALGQSRVHSHEDPAGISSLASIFLNCTHNSTIVNKAQRGIYVLSFPEKIDPTAIITSYQECWANSNFTAKHTADRWGIFPEVKYPPVDLLKNPEKKPDTLQFISVGRFFSGHHCKNFHIVIQAFIRYKESGGSGSLTLIGSVDAGHRDYFEHCERLSQGHDEIRLMPNCSFSEKKQQLMGAHFFVSATGCGISEEEHPERYEHFGMAVVESMSAGCVPIVFNGGGPIEFAQAGLLFNDETDLTDKFFDAQNIFLGKDFQKISKAQAQSSHYLYGDNILKTL